MLSVVGQRRVRGAVERSYGLNPANASAGRDDLAGMSHEQLRTSFGVFAASLLAGFDAYLAGPDVDLAQRRPRLPDRRAPPPRGRHRRVHRAPAGGLGPWRAPRPGRPPAPVQHRPDPGHRTRHHPQASYRERASSQQPERPARFAAAEGGTSARRGTYERGTESTTPATRSSSFASTPGVTFTGPADGSWVPLFIQRRALASVRAARSSRPVAPRRWRSGDRAPGARGRGSGSGSRGSFG